MSAEVSDKLTTTAGLIASAVPEQWGNFLAALQEYATEEAGMLVDASKDVEIRQGMARQAFYLLKLLRDSRENLEKIATRNAQRKVK